MAVYTTIDPAALARFMAGFDLGAVRSLDGIAEGVENSNYHLVTERGRFILTLYERRVAPDDLPFFLGLMEHLAARGVPCPVPVRGRDGSALHELCGRPAAIVSFLDGRSIERIGAPHCGALGGALADLHLAGRTFEGERPNDLSLDGWRRLAGASAGDADRVVPGLGAEIERELAELAAAWPAGLPRGVIHADLFPDNVFFERHAVTGLIDFYFACTDLLAYDIAICLNAWCFEPDGAFNITKARHLLRGYVERRPLEAAELEALPLLARGAAFRFLLTRLFDWQNRIEGALVRPKDPLEYLNKLRFHRGLRGPGAYGLA
ncbi:MAG TPA: homoserine kinase [Geminicoccaceae bacterium]